MRKQQTIFWNPTRLKKITIWTALLSFLGLFLKAGSVESEVFFVCSGFVFGLGLSLNETCRQARYSGGLVALPFLAVAVSAIVELGHLDISDIELLAWVFVLPGMLILFFQTRRALREARAHEADLLPPNESREMSD